MDKKLREIKKGNQIVSHQQSEDDDITVIKLWNPSEQVYRHPIITTSSSSSSSPGKEKKKDQLKRKP